MTIKGLAKEKMNRLLNLEMEGGLFKNGFQIMDRLIDKNRNLAAFLPYCEQNKRKQVELNMRVKAANSLASQEQQCV